MPHCTTMLLIMLVVFLRLGSSHAQAQGVLSAPPLNGAQLEQCKSLEGLGQLVASLPQAKSESKGAPSQDVGAAAYYWIWGYPLLNMAKAAVTSGTQRNAINKLFNQAQLITAQNQATLDIVAPNSDTIYQSGWLDLSKGPIALHAPDTHGRFYVLELLDFWTNVIGNPGTPTTGTSASKWVVLPLGYNKEVLPAQYKNATLYYSNTTAVWIIGRVYVEGAGDLAAAQAVQSAIREELISPASAQASQLQDAATTAYQLLQDSKWTLRTVNNATSAFVAIAGLAKAFPATPHTSAPEKTVSKLGLVPAKGFDQPQLSAQQGNVLRAGFVVGQACINAYSVSNQLGVSLPTGWSYTTKAGLYGNDYLLRAAVALIGLGANSPVVTIYATNTVDEKKQPLSGANGSVYTITFASVPPFKYFLSLTAYAVSNNLLMSNSYSDRANINFKATPGLQYDKDGSLKVYLSVNPPGPKGSKEYANWLPIAAEPFWTVLRVYGPSQELIEGKVPLPAFVRVK